jgi:hypothetical protein
MPAAKPLRYENFYEVSDQLASAVAEELFHSRIGRGDMAIDRSYNNCIRGGQKKLLEQRLRMFRSV